LDQIGSASEADTVFRAKVSNGQKAVVEVCPCRSSGLLQWATLLRSWRRQLPERHPRV